MARASSLAAAQRGSITRAQLLGCGLSDRQIDRLVRLGWLRVVHRGVYLVGHEHPAPGALLQAALLAVPGSALAGLTAAAHHGVSQYSGTIELVTAGRSGLRRPKLRIHRCPSLTEGDVVEVDGLRCVTAHRMCLQVATWHPGSLFRVLNEAERSLLSTGDLRGAGRGPARRVIRDALERLQPGGQELRSPKEADLLDALTAVEGLPSPQTNAWIAEIDASVDLLWPDVKLVVMVDGAQDHLRRSTFDRDRRVDNQLADLGHHVRRYPSWRIDHDLPAVLVEIAGVHRRLGR